MITLIAAIGRNREIGLNNQLLCKIPSDLKHFKAYTTGKPIIMGRNTFSSLGNNPLPGRRNIVVSSRPVALSNIIHAYSLEEALSIEESYDELVVIGGASIYDQTISLADKLVITHIDSEFIADSFFPEINPLMWDMSVIDYNVDNGYSYSICEYRRKSIEGS